MENQLSSFLPSNIQAEILNRQLNLLDQSKLLKAKVAVVGAGGLGCPLLQYLAAAGVGKILILDRDTVDWSNLNRQILHSASKVGVPKVYSAKQALKDLNPFVEIEVIQDALSPSHAEKFSQYDIICDCLDNFQTRYLLNDICVKIGKPLVSGSVLKWEGHLNVYNYNGWPCYRCVHPVPPPKAAVTKLAIAGIFGIVPGIIGQLQALTCVHIILGTEIKPQMTAFDAKNFTFKQYTMKSTKNSKCEVCGENPVVDINSFDYQSFANDI